MNAWRGGALSADESRRMPFQVSRTDRFEYFREQLGEADWTRKNVLDFGGADGGLLRDPRATIDVNRYWCIDVAAAAIAAGRDDYPNAHWLWYDRYSFHYNPRGVADLAIPDPGLQFDIIAAYSVFTSTRAAETVALVRQLEALLAPGGTLAFTFIDPHYPSWPDRYAGSNLRWRLEKERFEGAELHVSRLLARAGCAPYCILLNNTDLYLDDREIPEHPIAAQKTCHVYYTADRMAELLPEATIRRPPDNEMQHCCIISRG
jgi:SAM-dependent methyltransferase